MDTSMVEFLESGYALIGVGVIQAPLGINRFMPSALIRAFGAGVFGFEAPHDRFMARCDEVMRQRVARLQGFEVTSYSPSVQSIWYPWTEGETRVYRRNPSLLPHQLQYAIDNPEFRGGVQGMEPRRMHPIFLRVFRYYWGTAWQLVECLLPLDNAIAFLVDDRGFIQRPYLTRRNQDFPSILSGWYMGDNLVDFVASLDLPRLDHPSTPYCTLACFHGPPHIDRQPLNYRVPSPEEDWDLEIEMLRIAREEEHRLMEAVGGVQEPAVAEVLPVEAELEFPFNEEEAEIDAIERERIEAGLPPEEEFLEIEMDSGNGPEKFVII